MEMNLLERDDLHTALSLTLSDFKSCQIHEQTNIVQYFSSFCSLEALVIQQKYETNDRSIVEKDEQIFQFARQINSPFIGQVYHHTCDKNGRSLLVLERYNKTFETFLKHEQNIFGGTFENPAISSRFRGVMNGYLRAMCYLEKRAILHDTLDLDNFAVVDDKPRGLLVQLRPRGTPLNGCTGIQEDIHRMFVAIRNVFPSIEKNLVFCRLVKTIEFLITCSSDVVRSMYHFDKHPIFLTPDRKMDITVVVLCHYNRHLLKEEFISMLKYATIHIAPGPEDWRDLVSENERLREIMNFRSYSRSILDFLKFTRNLHCHMTEIADHAFESVAEAYEAIELVWPHFIDALYFAYSESPTEGGLQELVPEEK